MPFRTDPVFDAGDLKAPEDVYLMFNAGPAGHIHIVLHLDILSLSPEDGLEDGLCQPFVFHRFGEEFSIHFLHGLTPPFTGPRLLVAVDRLRAEKLGNLRLRLFID